MFPIRALLIPAFGMGLQASTPVHLGGSVHISAPLSDLRTDLHDKVGFGGSFQVSFELNERAIIRPRFDIDRYPVSSHVRPHSNDQEEIGFNSVGLGADWLYRLSGKQNEGAYCLAGAGLLRWYQTYNTLDGHRNHTWYWSDTKKNRLSPWIALGAGYQFNRIVGMELRGLTSHYDSPETGGLQAPFYAEVPTTTRTAIAVQTVLTLRW